LKEAAVAVRSRDLRLILTDVDGVLTDGTLWFSADGAESKGFHARDGLAAKLAMAAGLELGMISGRSSDVVSRRARELGIEIVLQGIKDKKARVEQLLAERGLAWTNVAYIGDDVVDTACMNAAALSAAPADAPLDIRAQAFMITDAAGGHGAFREFVEAILRARGDWERVIAPYGATAL
jgi:3-deoxy-D-manno-octulosonate 8-phosphate phosphatase (KDO 8-P phosphatase)